MVPYPRPNGRAKLTMSLSYSIFNKIKGLGDRQIVSHFPFRQVEGDFLAWMVID
jgi:hypothetical protein